MLRTLISGGNDASLLTLYFEIIRRKGATRDEEIAMCIDRWAVSRGQPALTTDSNEGQGIRLAGTPDRDKVTNHHAGRPSLKRNVSVSPPLTFTTSRASVRSAPFCLILDPVISRGSSTLNTMPTSSRNFLGQRKICPPSGLLFSTRYTTGFPPVGGTSFSSSTMPLKVVSVVGSYLGACENAGTARDTIAAMFRRDVKIGPDRVISGPPCRAS